MRVVLDTNILISALIVESGTPGLIYRKWTQRGFTLLSSQPQLQELHATLRKPALAIRIIPYDAGTLFNRLKRFAVMVDPLPQVSRSPDPYDDFLLATAEGGKADYLVTGDKSHLLALVRHKGTSITTAANFAAQFV